jgi:hypothetical protein
MMGLFRPARVKCWEREIPLIDYKAAVVGEELSMEPVLLFMCGASG